MRDILYRGKRNSNGKWVEGWYVMQSTSISHPYSRENGKHRIVTAPHNIDYEVDKETVGQYTGKPIRMGMAFLSGTLSQLIQKTDILLLSGILKQQDL